MNLSRSHALTARPPLIDDLRQAIDQDTCGLAFLPVIGLGDGRVQHHEVVLRWRHPSRGVRRVDDLFPLAGQAGLMHPLDDWLFERAAEQLQRWAADSAGATPQRLAITVSASRFLAAPDSLMRWRATLDRLGLTRHQLLLAVDHVGALMGGMPGHGLAADILKIDRSVLAGIEHDAQALARCEGLVEQAHQLGLRAVADGVETPAQRAVLEAIGCDLGQGHLFAAPSHDGTCHA
ncbi:EAL domain-containing protein [Leptothrix sp. BB-4]